MLNGVENFTTHELRAVLAVAETLSFTKSAKRLNISKGSVSKTIASFERKIDRTIFNRSTRVVLLEDGAISFIIQIKKILKLIDSKNSPFSAHKH